MKLSRHHISLLTVVVAAPMLGAGVRHSRSLGGTGQPIPRTQPVQPAPGSSNMNQGVPIQAPNQTPIQVPQQQYLPGLQVPSPVAPPMPVQIPNQGGVPENGTGSLQTSPPTDSAAPIVVPGNAVKGNQPKQNPQPQDPYIPPAPMVIPPPVPVQVPEQLQQSGTPQQSQTPIQLPVQVPVQAQPSLPQGAQPLPLQGQPTLPPSPPGSGSGDRYMMPTYGMAGCGLGSMVFSRNVRSEQWMAAILNDGFFPQSFSISTGTSNCVDVDEEQSQAEQEIFIDSNFHALRVDAARGDGESLRAYAELLGCHKEGLYDSFASLSQGQFSYIFSDAQPRSVAERYRDSLKRSRALKTRCDRLF